MAKTIKKLNDFPTVVKSPTRYTGGKNANVTVEKNPTRYTGGKNPEAKVSPKS